MKAYAAVLQYLRLIKLGWRILFIYLFPFLKGSCRGVLYVGWGVAVLYRREHLEIQRLYKGHTMRTSHTKDNISTMYTRHCNIKPIIRTRNKWRAKQYVKVIHPEHIFTQDSLNFVGLEITVVLVERSLQSDVVEKEKKRVKSGDSLCNRKCKWGITVSRIGNTVRGKGVWRINRKCCDAICKKELMCNVYDVK